MTRNKAPDSRNSVLRTGAAHKARAIMLSCGTRPEWAISSASVVRFVIVLGSLEQYAPAIIRQCHGQGAELSESDRNLDWPNDFDRKARSADHDGLQLRGDRADHR